MRQIAHYLMLAVVTTACTTLPAQTSDSRNLQERYPYSIIGNDLGLLNEEDILISHCVAKAEPFSLQKLTSHPYWQCFSTQGSAVECDEADPDEGGRTAILAIVLKKDGAVHEYLSRRAISLKDCKEHAREWVRLTASEDHVCVSGQFINPSENAPDRTDRAWIFESFKTARGCDSYFDDGCSLANKIKHGCDLAEMANGTHGKGE
jgi:hypothetical protein